MPRKKVETSASNEAKEKSAKTQAETKSKEIKEKENAAEEIVNKGKPKTAKKEKAELNETETKAVSSDKEGTIASSTIEDSRVEVIGDLEDANEEFEYELDEEEKYEFGEEEFNESFTDLSPQLNVYSNKYRQEKIDVWPFLKQFVITKKPIPVRIVTIDCITFGNKTEDVVVATMQGEPYDEFDIYIPCSEFYLDKYIKYYDYDQLTKEQLFDRLRNYIGAVTYVCLTKAICSIKNNSFTVFASRKLAMKIIERRFFRRGITIGKTGEKRTLHDNMIVRNCPVVRVYPYNIVVEICGVETSIPFEELNWRYIRKAEEKFSKGDFVDVYIEKISVKNENYIIDASTKRTQPNPTLKKLKHYAQRTGRMGDILATVVRVNLDRPCYFLWTEGGYNAIAIKYIQEGGLKKAFENPNLLENAVVGSQVIFRPYQMTKKEDAMVGAIVGIVKR